jgi:GrpB-like predicted nucleotidyltransferase (UPF0157 family)
MSPSDLGKLFPIYLTDPDPEWPSIYQREKEIIIRELGSEAIKQIDHVGSTSIAGLIAKPSIDILLQVPADQKDSETIAALKRIGYHYLYKPENPPPHMLFVKGYTEQGFAGQAFHVHVRYPGDWEEIYFRDFLRQDPESRQAYVRLKQKLAIKFKNDREGYTDAKTEFIMNINKLARNRINR